MKISSKFTIIFLILAVAIGFSIYEKKKMDSYFDESAAPVLKELPAIQGLTEFNSDKPITFDEILSGSNGMLVHFWGTWCAPCEFELPEFLEFSKKLGEMNVKVVLLAVNDDDIKIKKFMKRFGTLSSNIVLIHDKTNQAMTKFGVVKVPETFLFNTKKLNMTKFVGPQDWKLQSYISRVMNYLAI
ncbi:redoxin domain-containing protein [Bacteriovorax sp. Seq25_V]|uniref:TlpA family protein disulfide reductase n=1 Tax=Bacteriovorax sp. Seq25_V TaxID=1201288 RepID=UPI000389EC99|nr:redoxin domain-containing protein [Bacteriovorax sp. Seq25_V]EQC46927.1 redoxin [Bacteriovorax sp. Seq25_V]